MSSEESAKSIYPQPDAASGPAAPRLERDSIIGSRIGNCVVQKWIGSGSMGSVFLAHHVGLNKPVAIKILSAFQGIGGTDLVQRFVREARLAAALEHPNIVQVHDVGEIGGLHYLTLQYVDGRSLDKVLEERRVVPLAEAMDIVKKVGSALAAAHRMNIIHRDIKPANILLGNDGTVKVVDFGLARSIDAASPSLSLTGQIVGTPHYISPEQAQDRPVDGRADLYSLGATFYHLVTGKRCFEGESALAVVFKHVNDRPRPPHEVNPDLPPQVSVVIGKMMAKDRDARYASAEEFLAALDRLAVEIGLTRPADAGWDAFLPLKDAPNSPRPADEARRILELGGETMLDLSGGAAPAAPGATAQKDPLQVQRDFTGSGSSPESKAKAEGKAVVGKYHLIQSLREDSDAVLWEADDLLQNRRVALRVLKDGSPETARKVHSLVTEARQLDHPNILAVYDAGTDLDSKGRVILYMAMEPVLDGVPLDRALAAGTQVRKDVLLLFLQIADALEHAHQKGIVHGRLKTADILLEASSRAVVVFFDLDRILLGPEKPKEDETALKLAMAADSYLAPEQLPGVEETIDARTDVWHLGMMLYEYLTGANPFAGPTRAETYRRILHEELPPLGPRGSDTVDPELQAILDKALEKHRDLRPATGGAFAAELRKYLKIDLAPAPPPAVRRQIPQTLRKRLRKWFLMNRRKILIRGGALLLAVGLPGIWIASRSAKSASEESQKAKEFSRLYLEAFKCQEAKQWAEGLRCCQQALQIHPNTDLSRLSVNCEQNLLQETLEERTQVLDKLSYAGGAPLEQYHESATLLLTSINDMSQFLGRTPDKQDVKLLSVLGRACLVAGDLVRAELPLQRALEDEGVTPEVGLNLARAYFGRLVREAQVVEITGDRTVADARANQWLLKMAQALQGPLKTKRTGVDVRLAEAYLAFARRDVSQVEAACTQALRDFAGQKGAEELHLLRACAVGEADPRDRDLGLALGLKPQMALGYLVRGTRRYLRGDLKAAMADYDRIVELEPAAPLSYYFRGEARLQVGDTSGAVSDLARAQVLAPKDWDHTVRVERLMRSIPEASRTRPEK